MGKGSKGSNDDDNDKREAMEKNNEKIQFTINSMIKLNGSNCLCPPEYNGPSRGYSNHLLQFYIGEQDLLENGLKFLDDANPQAAQVRVRAASLQDAAAKVSSYDYFGDTVATALQEEYNKPNDTGRPFALKMNLSSYNSMVPKLATSTKKLFVTFVIS